jgi:hypothetical protein
MEDQTAELALELNKAYGDAVQVEYVDIFSSAMSAHQQELRLIMNGNVEVPLISINGEPKFAGGISLEMIDEELRGLGLSPVQAGA